TSMVHAADVNDEDVQALRDWINSKRMITVRELGGQLSISGEVRAELQSINQTTNGKAERGRGTGKPSNDYDVEFNLGIDYRTENTWAAARIKFDNDAGTFTENIGSGTNNKIRVDKAYFGYRVIDGDRHTAEIEVGRRVMLLVFDSKLQFVSNFDGVNFKDSYSVDKVGDLYYQLGAFIVNEKVSQAAYVGELGILNVANTGFYTKYSLIDWDTKEVDKVPEEFHFIVSQLLLGYKFIPQPWDKVVNFYLGGLYNHRARALAITDNRRANFGGYLGFAIGQIKKAGDWNFEANYQVLAGQCVPAFDVSGAGMGSRKGHSFYYEEKDKEIKPVKDRHKPEGNVNYRGFKLVLQYMLTNNLNLFQEWSQTITLDTHIGPFRKYKQYEVELIYAF
ncbi:MAG TPA: hypothetical protein VMR37_00415, partial [Rhabdochlamydiaceae bacterium]|nr:hypothetical protein [Rhabdochlamydiaceae bacterium]